MSKIEQMIDQIEEYIEGCKYQTLSSYKIIVNKEEIKELLRELRMKTPEEIKLYQKILSNKEAILNDAKMKAEKLIQDATARTNELLSEHEIMQQAYAQANEVIQEATKRAQDTLDAATTEANNMRAAAMQYTDDILANLEGLITHTMNDLATRYQGVSASLNNVNEIIKSNRRELNPPEAEDAMEFDISEGAELDTENSNKALDIL